MRITLSLFFWLITYTLVSQDCDCDILLSELSADQQNIIDGTTYNYAAGATICIPAGRYAGLQFVNFRGAPNNYLRIVNCDGRVAILERIRSGITFKNSQYIRLTGTGDDTFSLGIRIESCLGPGAAGISLSDFSSDFEIDHIEIQQTSFAGIVGKTDPRCDDPTTWRRNGYVLSNLNIHNNYIHDIGNEGIYLGYTGGYLVTSNVVCDGEFVFGHWLENIDIHQNVFENIGWDAIQVNLARERGSIHDNTILSYGLQDRKFQNFLMSLAGGAYEVFNNLIINPEGGTGQGIQLLSAKSNSKLFNNVIVNPNFHGIFIHNRHAFNSMERGYIIANNTIVDPENSGIFYNTTITQSSNQNLVGSGQENIPTFFINNLIVNPGNRYELDNTWKGERENFIDMQNIATRDAARSRTATNLFTRNIDTLCIASISDYDFRPGSASSPLVDAGSNLIGEGVVFDKSNFPRPEEQLFDIGAYEYQGEVLNFDCVDLGNDVVEDSVVNYIGTLVVPNPARDTVRLLYDKKDGATLQLFSQNGTLIADIPYTSGVAFYVGDLSEGIYIAKLIFDKGYELHKIVIR